MRVVDNHPTRPQGFSYQMGYKWTLMVAHYIIKPTARSMGVCGMTSDNDVTNLSSHANQPPTNTTTFIISSDFSKKPPEDDVHWRTNEPGRH